MSKEQKNTVIGGLLMVFAYGLSNNIVAYYITPVTEALGYTRAAFNLCFTLMAVVSFLSAPLYGCLFMKVPVRRMILAGGVVGAACFFGYSLCRNIYAFYAVGILQGLVQSGSTNMAIVVLISRFFDERKSGTATGIVMAGTGICSLTMGAVLPPVIEQYGWDRGYMLCGALWAIVMLAAWAILKEHPARTAENREKTEAEAGMPYRQVLRCGGFYVLIVCVLLCNMIMICSQHLHAYFQDVGLGSVEAGRVMMVFSFGLIVWKILLGQMYDRLGASMAIVISYTAFMAGLWILSLESLWALVIGSVISALGIASSTVLFPLITRKIFGGKEYAPIWSLVSMATAFGVAVGSPVWGACHDLLGSYRAAFLGAPVLLAGVMVLLLVLLRKKYY